MPKNMVIIEENASNNIKFFYELIKSKSLLQELMKSCSVKSLDALRWSYRKSRISIGQIEGYQKILGADIAKTEYFTGTEVLTSQLKGNIEEHVFNTNYELDNLDYVETDPFYIYRKKLLNCKTEEELKKYQSQLEYLQKLIENEEILHEINFTTGEK